MRYTVLLTATLLCFALGGCGKLNLYNKDSKDQVVASVGESQLYRSDLLKALGPNLSSTDSAQMAEAFIRQWITGELKYLAAEEAVKDHQQDIDQMVKEYRSQLIRYRYEADFVDRHADTIVTDDQISQYYNQNKENFRLVGPIVKARVVRIPADIRSDKKMEDMFRSSDRELRQAFQNICDKNGYRYDDYSNEWVDFNTVVGHLPFTIKDFDDFLKNKSFYESQEGEYKYMMVIDSYLLAGDISPESRQRNSIRKMLLHKRRSDVLKTLEDSLFKEAEKERKFTIN